VAAPSEKSAAELEVILAGLEKDSNRLAALLRQSPPDLKAARTIYDGLASFDNGLDKLGDLLKPDRVDAMKEGLVGLEGSLTSTATEVDKVSALSYPLVTFNGVRPNVEMKPFWPDGEKVADGLRKATKGVQAANKELDAMSKNLPDVQKALTDSRKSVAVTRESLGKAIRHQDETEKLLKSVPEQTAVLAEALPKMGKTLAQMLRETQKLRELATGLRAVRKTLDDTITVWPDVAKGLKKSAAVLDQARLQLDTAGANREEYEKAMESSSQVARSLADMLPAFTDQFDSRLGQQEASLEQMEAGLGEVNESLPVIESKTNEVMRTVKLLLYLMAGLVALHAGYVLLEPARAFAASAKPQAAPSVT
jgi:ABC-type transporter Mla subunit MlaD